MKTTAKTIALAGIGLAFAQPLLAQGISDDVIRVGIMNDQSGPYTDNCGPGSVAAARLAIEDVGGAIDGKKIELVIADDQNKPDIGVAIATRWIENDGVDAIIGCSASSIAASVQELMAKHDKPYMLAGTSSAFFTNEKCTNGTSQWIQDTYALPKAIVNTLMDQGEDTWFFITVDYNFGKAWQADATHFIEQRGGKVLGSALHPLNGTDFSAQILQAQSSGAKIIAIANSGTDFANTIKAAKEFGITGSEQMLVPLGLFINTAHGIGIEYLSNVPLTTPFYWDADEESRAFTARYRAAFNDRFPNEPQASTFSAMTHYLKAVAAAQTDDGKTVNAKMRELPVHDALIKDAQIRADGQVMRSLHKARIKSPAESKGLYDYYELTGTIAPSDAWRSPADSQCPLLTKS